MMDNKTKVLELLRLNFYDYPVTKLEEIAKKIDEFYAHPPLAKEIE